MEILAPVPYQGSCSCKLVGIGLSTNLGYWSLPSLLSALPAGVGRLDLSSALLGPLDLPSVAVGLLSVRRCSYGSGILAFLATSRALCYYYIVGHCNCLHTEYGF